jgi:MFS family permease
MDWLKLWIGTFFKKPNAKYTFEDGILSVAFASVIIGILNFLSSMMDSTVELTGSLAINVIVLPIVIVIGLLVFAAVFRWIAGMHKGKGDFKKDCAAMGVYLGSLIFAAGMVLFIFGLIASAFFNTADAASINYFLMFLVIGIALALVACIAVTVFGLWLEELAAAEKLNTYTAAKVLGLAVAVMVFVLLAVMGAVIELSIGPYKALAQYGGNYTLGV